MDAIAARRTGLILISLGAFQTALIVLFRAAFIGPLFRHLERAEPLAWALALAVAAAYIAYSIRGLPILGGLLLKATPFKLVGIAIAVPAAILEEVFFRGYIMNALVALPVIVQIVASGVAFGVVHAVWGLRGGLRAVYGAVASTTVMGIALAVVFLVSGRAILPCVVSHFLITGILEPWLLYAYIVRAQGAIAR